MLAISRKHNCSRSRPGHTGQATCCSVFGDQGPQYLGITLVHVQWLGFAVDQQMSIVTPMSAGTLLMEVVPPAAAVTVDLHKGMVVEMFLYCSQLSVSEILYSPGGKKQTI